MAKRCGCKASFTHRALPGPLDPPLDPTRAPTSLCVNYFVLIWEHAPLWRNIDRRSSSGASFFGDLFSICRRWFNLSYLVSIYIQTVGRFLFQRGGIAGKLQRVSESEEEGAGGQWVNRGLATHFHLDRLI